MDASQDSVMETNASNVRKASSRRIVPVSSVMTHVRIVSLQQNVQSARTDGSLIPNTENV
jgi:hypothetical protein